MKILLTVHQFYPDFFSGTEVLTFSVAQELMRRGHQVVVFTGCPVKHQMLHWDRFDRYVVDGIEVHRFSHSFAPMGDQYVLSELEYDNHLATAFFVYLLDTVRPDIVHFFHLSRLGSVLVDAVRQKAVPAYYTPTDFWAVCPTIQLLLENGSICPGPSANGGNCIKHVAGLTHWRHLATLMQYIPDRIMDAIASFARSTILCPFPFRQEIAALSQRLSFNITRLNALHGIFSPTKLMTDVLTRNGVDPDLIVQSAYGLDISGFDGIQRKFDPTKPLTIGYIGTLIPHKGCQVLIEAFLRLKNKDVRLHVYGDMGQFPDYVEKLKNLAGERRNIAFLGTFPNERIAEIFAGIDVLVVPSLWYENTPLVVYSALAAKCPVITSNFPGMSEVVFNGNNGLTFEPGNIEELHQCLHRVAQNPSLLQTLSAHCQKPKSIAAYVDELLASYCEENRSHLHDLLPRLPIEPYQPETPHGYILGWAAVAFTEARSIRLVAAGREIGRTTHMQPRPDVRNHFRRLGRFTSCIRYGFALAIKESMDRATAELVVEDQTGDLQQIPLSALPVGRSVQVGINTVVGIDAAEFPVTHADKQ